jgi:uncharacterized protein
MESPCVKVCVIDPQSGVCGGCRRSLAEIAAWSSFSSAERRRIMASLPSRAQPRGRAAGKVLKPVLGEG